MSKKNAGGPALPIPSPEMTIPGQMLAQPQGMTLRDYFAAKELSKKDSTYLLDTPEAYQRLAEHCYRMADAMLARRK